MSQASAAAPQVSVAAAYRAVSLAVVPQLVAVQFSTTHVALPSTLGAPANLGQQLALQTRARRAPTRKTAVVKLGEHKIELAYPLTSMKSDEFAELATLESGGEVRFFSGPALRLRNDVALQFGEHQVPVGNVAPGFDGIYSLWIRKAVEGWELVFNDEGDVWGTQHDPAADRLVVPLQHTLAADDEETFAADLSWNEGARGTLELAWGAHRWSAGFTAADSP
jgi:hypothetical protein